VHSLLLFVVIDVQTLFPEQGGVLHPINIISKMLKIAPANKRKVIFLFILSPFYL